MRYATLVAAVISSLFSGYVGAFTSPSCYGRCSIALSSTVEPSTEELAASSNEDIDIPTNLPSDIGMDYVPLATMLATGQFEEADQFTRDALIVLAGSKNAGRNFVYFTEVKRIPSTDLATIERLWVKFSKGKFGYSVQKVRFSILFHDF
jgi:GUN4-like